MKKLFKPFFYNEEIENCNIFNYSFKKSFKVDLLKIIKHPEKLDQFFCKNCNFIMPLSDKQSHLEFDQQKVPIRKFGVMIVRNLYKMV